MIRFACPGCNATFSVDDAKGGKTGKCPKCQTQFLIPEAQGGDSFASPASPPPPPPRVNPNEPVEINPCPGCQARLSVTGADLGADVECPYCKKVYKAVKAGSSLSVPPLRLGEVERTGGRNRREEEDDRPSRRRRYDDDDDEDDRPSRRRRREEDDDDDEDDRPRTKKRRRRRNYEPHRGNMILIFGVLGWVVCLIFGIVAWVMGNSDLRKMDEGIMDPEGRSLTNVGRMLGMVQCILAMICLPVYVVLVVVGAVGGGGR